MDLDLPADVADRVLELLASGRYASADEVVREALLVLEHRDRLLEQIAEGDRSAREKPVVDGPAAIARLVARLRKSEE